MSPPVGRRPKTPVVRREVTDPEGSVPVDDAGTEHQPGTCSEWVSFGQRKGDELPSRCFKEVFRPLFSDTLSRCPLRCVGADRGFWSPQN